VAEIIFTCEDAGKCLIRFLATRCKSDMTRKENAMIDLVAQLVLFLSKDQLTVEEVTAKVGRVAHDPGIHMPIRLRPLLAGVRSAKLARYPDSGLPYVLTLEPALDSRPAVGALKAVLGAYRRALTGRGMPAELVFPPGRNEPHWHVVVIVTVDNAPKEMDSARTTSIVFRRDPVTQ
jgi:hypothetical protein